MFFPVILAAVCYPGADSKASSTGLWSAGAAGRCTLPRSASPSLLVLRPPLPFASVSSVGGSDAVSPEPPCPLCCWCCLIRRGALPACFLSTSCLRVGLGTALAPCITPSCRSSAWSGIHARPPPRFRRPPRLPCPALPCPARLTSPHPLSGPSGSHGHSPTPMPVLFPVCSCSFVLTLGPSCCWRLFSPAGLGRWRQ